MRVMNEDFYKQRAQEVRDLAAKADPFIKQRLLDLAERYDGRKTRITPLPSAPAAIQNQPSDRDGDSG
jgi:hypothetical protein